MIDINLIKVDSLPSTNDYLKRFLKTDNLPEGTIIISPDQHNGKGQQGNSWESEKDKNLTFSLLIYPGTPAEKMFMISKMISLSLITVLEEYHTGFSIKWPNDIYYNNKKIAGILIENQIIGSSIKYSIIGIGVNINQKIFKSDAPNPISLTQITKQTININEVLKLFTEQLNIWYNKLLNEQYALISSNYFNKLYRNSGFHAFAQNQELFNAQIVSIDDDGQMHLEKTDGKQIGFYFKEVEFVI